MANDKLTYETVEAQARACGLYLRRWNPGDGWRFRAFTEHEWHPHLEYHDANGRCTTMSLREMHHFVRGWRMAMEYAIECDEAANGPIPTFLRRQA